MLSCHNVSKKVGETGTEVVTSIKEGIDKNLECTIELSKPLTDKGLSTGKYTINNSTISVYFIFDKDLNDNITAKIFDSNGKEYGRINMNLTGKKGEAKFVDLAFDSRTNIESKSKLVIE
jgi:hypothetical protein